MKKIVIFGMGETGHLAYEYFTHDPNYADHEVVAFCGEKQYMTGDSFVGLPVVAMDDVATRFPPVDYMGFVALGSGRLNRDRANLYNRVKAMGYGLASYVSAKAFVWHNVEIGDNCFILENNTLQPFVTIGNNVVLWSGNHIGHRTVIADHCFLTSHVVVSGFCQIGAHSFVGVNATFADHVTVGRDNFIAMHTAVNKNTQDNGFYTGNPMELKTVSAKRFCKVRDV